MTKDELLLLVSAKLPKNVIDELKICNTIDEMVVVLPEAIGREIVRLLTSTEQAGERLNDE